MAVEGPQPPAPPKPEPEQASAAVEADAEPFSQAAAQLPELPLLQESPVQVFSAQNGPAQEASAPEGPAPEGPSPEDPAHAPAPEALALPLAEVRRAAPFRHVGRYLVPHGRALWSGGQESDVSGVFCPFSIQAVLESQSGDASLADFVVAGNGCGWSDRFECSPRLSFLLRSLLAPTEVLALEPRLDGTVLTVQVALSDRPFGGADADRDAVYPRRFDVAQTELGVPLFVTFERGPIDLLTSHDAMERPARLPVDRDADALLLELPAQWLDLPAKAAASEAPPLAAYEEDPLKTPAFRPLENSGWIAWFSLFGHVVNLVFAHLEPHDTLVQVMVQFAIPQAYWLCVDLLHDRFLLRRKAGCESSGQLMHHMRCRFVSRSGVSTAAEHLRIRFLRQALEESKLTLGALECALAHLRPPAWVYPVADVFTCWLGNYVIDAPATNRAQGIYAEPAVLHGEGELCCAVVAWRRSFEVLIEWANSWEEGADVDRPAALALLGRWSEPGIGIRLCEARFTEEEHLLLLFVLRRAVRALQKESAATATPAVGEAAAPPRFSAEERARQAGELLLEELEREAALEQAAKDKKSIKKERKKKGIQKDKKADDTTKGENTLTSKAVAATKPAETRATAKVIQIAKADRAEMPTELARLAEAPSLEAPVVASEDTRATTKDDGALQSTKAEKKQRKKATTPASCRKAAQSYSSGAAPAEPERVPQRQRADDVLAAVSKSEQLHSKRLERRRAATVSSGGAPTAFASLPSEHVPYKLETKARDGHMSAANTAEAATSAAAAAASAAASVAIHSRGASAKEQKRQDLPFGRGGGEKKSLDLLRRQRSTTSSTACSEASTTESSGIDSSRSIGSDSNRFVSTSSGSSLTDERRCDRSGSGALSLLREDSGSSIAFDKCPDAELEASGFAGVSILPDASPDERPNAAGFGGASAAVLAFQLSMKFPAAKVHVFSPVAPSDATTPASPAPPSLLGEDSYVGDSAFCPRVFDTFEPAVAPMPTANAVVPTANAAVLAMAPAKKESTREPATVLAKETAMEPWEPAKPAVPMVKVDSKAAEGTSGAAADVDEPLTLPTFGADGSSWRSQLRRRGERLLAQFPVKRRQDAEMARSRNEAGQLDLVQSGAEGPERTSGLLVGADFVGGEAFGNFFDNPFAAPLAFGEAFGDTFGACWPVPGSTDFPVAFCRFEGWGVGLGDPAPLHIDGGVDCGLTAVWSPFSLTAMPAGQSPPWACEPLAVNAMEARTHVGICPPSFVGLSKADAAALAAQLRAAQPESYED